MPANIITASLSRLPRLIIITVLCFAGIFSSADRSAAAEKAGSMALLPVIVQTEQDLSYLKESLRDMLTSRLVANTGIMVVDKYRTDSLLAATVKIPEDERLQRLASELQADYLLESSLTGNQAGLRLNAQVIRISEPAAVHDFQITASNEDALMAAINQLSLEIAETVFGNQRPAVAVKTTQPKPVSMTPEYSSFKTAHPEREFMYPSADGVIRPMAITGTAGFIKTLDININLQAMDIGDINGDGADDLVLASRSEVLVFSRADYRFKQFGQIRLANRQKIHAISLADLNSNGRNEIYISAADDQGPYSLAVEWQQDDFSYLFNNAPWYIRTLSLPGKGTVLVGQRPATDTPLQPGIFQLAQMGTSLQAKEKINVPEQVSLFDFAIADLDNDGRVEIIAIDQSDLLNIYGTDGRLLWKSSEYYGGSLRYVGELNNIDNPGYGDVQPDHEQPERIYIPSRILVMDINNDGLQELMLNRNISKSSRILKYWKSYTNAEIVALAWNGISLSEVWKTKKIDGYIADYQLRPKAEMKAADLYISLVLNLNWLGSFAADSAVLQYEMIFPDIQAESQATAGDGSTSIFLK